jgi:hypothetical protein
MQTDAAGHGWPQAPQLSGSVERETHAPRHSASPGRQPQAPAMHCRLRPQALSHAPQCAALFPVSTQALPHWAPVGHAHAPRVQTAPAEQAAAQAPQFSASVWRSTQPPAQSTVPPGHAATHWAAAHTFVDAQATPQAPQSFGSVSSRTHCPPQFVVPSGQEQVPPLHCRPPLQAMPQPPQFAPSLVGSTQAPLHSDRGAGQPGEQVPALQTWPVAHALPQPPQFAGSLVVLAQRPAQRVTPGPQEHCPPTQAVPAGHARSQLPQCAALESSRAHVPLQSAWPAGHASRHAPPEHTWAAGQNVPHSPQFRGSPDGSTHSDPQRTAPGAQPHTPLTHDAVRVHATVQPPQCVGSEKRSTQAP